MSIKHLLFIFLPALLLLSIFFFIRVIQYHPLNPTPVSNTLPDIDKSNAKGVIPLFPEDPILGPKNASKTLIVFGDFGCESCKEEFTLLQELMLQNPGKLKIIWKGLSVEKVPIDTTLAVQYGFCASKQNKFSEWSEIAFANSTALSEENLPALAEQIGLNAKTLTSCLSAPDTTSYMKKIEQLAEALSIQTVPTIFFNNTQINPPTSVDGWKALLSL